MPLSHTRPKRTSELNLPLIILTAVFIMGLVGGVVISIWAPPEFSERIVTAAANFLHSRSTLGFSETLAESFFSATLLTILLFLLGFGGIYQPFAVLILLIRGLGIGTALSFIYAGEITPENFAAVVSVLPFIAFSSFVHILACRESLRMSTGILRVSLAAPGEYKSVDYSLYINKFIILLFVTAIISIIDALINIAV
jgi:stage II sporulation protein M